MKTADPIRPTDDDARAQARGLLDEARIAALGVIDPATGAPHVTRIAFARLPDRRCLSLVSDLAFHADALRHAPACSLLLGMPGPKGDPLTHPRLTLAARAQFVEKDAQTRAAWLDIHPKSKLYIDFADFNFVRFAPVSAALNGGFGRAYHLTPEDLG